MKKILFFGATGRLGTHWTKELIKKNIVYALIHKNKKIFKSENLYKIKLNLKDTEEIIDFCKTNKISTIINTVALTNVEKCETNYKQANEINCMIPLRLCRVAKKLDIQIVHISTDMLFDGKKKNKYSETSKYNPLNVYSETKVKAEKFLLSYKKTLIIRTNFFGFSSKKNPTISDKLIYEQKNKKTSYLWNDVYFTPIYIKNLLFFLNLLIKNKYYGIFNISSDECISKYDFGKKIAKSIFKESIIYSNKFDKNYFTNRPLNMCLSNKKIKRKFHNYKNKLTFNYQLKCFLKDYKLINNE